jgi:hypothetical protein
VRLVEEGTVLLGPMRFKGCSYIEPISPIDHRGLRIAKKGECILAVIIATDEQWLYGSLG